MIIQVPGLAICRDSKCILYLQISVLYLKMNMNTMISYHTLINTVNIVFVSPDFIGKLFHFAVTILIGHIPSLINIKKYKLYIYAILRI